MYAGRMIVYEFAYIGRLGLFLPRKASLSPVLGKSTKLPSVLVEDVYELEIKVNCLILNPTLLLALFLLYFLLDRWHSQSVT